MTEQPFHSDPAGLDPFTPEGRHIVVVSAGLSKPSSTRMLADRLTEAATSELANLGVVPHLHQLELRELSGDIADSLLAPHRSEALAEALAQVEQADGIIAATPTFKASYSGLFKSFWDLVDDEAIVNTPVLLGATGGTQRHSLMIEHSLFPLFAYLRAKIIPTAVFAASDDWGEVDGAAESTRTTSLEQRVQDAGRDLAEVVARLPAKRRAANDEPLEVVPFAKLLRGQR